MHLSFRLFFCLVASFATAVALAACGSSSDGGSSTGSGGGASTTANEAGNTSSEGGSYEIAYIPPVSALPSIQALESALKQKADTLGMSVKTLGGQFDPKVQIAAAETAINSGVDAILVWPIDPNSLAPVLNEAKEAGIKILVTDSPSLVEDGLAEVNFQENLEKSAKEVAAETANLIEGDCKVGVIQGVPTVEVLAAKNKGLEEGAKEAGCEVLATQINQKDTSDGARPIIDAWKTEFGSEMTGILSYNDASALAAVSAIDGTFKPLIAGMNGEPQVIEEIEAGRIAVDAEFQAPEIGNGMAQAAKDLLSGEEVPPTILVEANLLTKNNIGEYESWEDRLKAPQEVSWPETNGEAVLTVNK